MFRDGTRPYLDIPDGVLDGMAMSERAARDEAARAPTSGIPLLSHDRPTLPGSSVEALLPTPCRRVFRWPLDPVRRGPGCMSRQRRRHGHSRGRDQPHEEAGCAPGLPSGIRRPCLTRARGRASLARSPSLALTFENRCPPMDKCRPATRARHASSELELRIFRREAIHRTVRWLSRRPRRLLSLDRVPEVHPE